MKKLLMILALTASPAWAEVVVENPWARSVPEGAKTAAAYFVLKNTGEDTALVGAHSPVAAQAQVHVTQYDQTGIMQMKHLDRVPLTKGVEVGFAPGGHHIMLIGLRQPLEEGFEFPLKLMFEDKTWKMVRVAIKPINYTPSER